MRASVAFRRSFVAALLLAASFAASAAGEVYKWKDANGQWHYGDKPPADQQADVVPIAPPPNAASTYVPPAPVEPATGKGKGKKRKSEPQPEPEVLPGLWSEVEAQKAPLKPRTVREVQRGCAAIVNECKGVPGKDTTTCLSEVRACAADPTMEKQDCCPAACGVRYAQLRSQGLPEGLAFTRAVFSEPSCVPGADGLPETPN